MATKNCPPITLGPWPLGMNNRLAEFELAKGDAGNFLRDAVNVDISNHGRVRRRKGATLAFAGDTHSAHGSPKGLFYVDGSSLLRKVKQADGSFSASTVLTGLSIGRRMSYLDLNDQLYFSNGVITRRLDTTDTLAPWGLPTPNPQPSLAAGGAGALHAGRYLVAITYVAANGEESGADKTGYVDITEGQSILVTNIPVPTDPYITTVRVYRSKHNDDQLYRAADLAVGTTSATLSASSALGRPLTTLLCEPFPPALDLEHYNGRIYGVVDNFLVFSMPMQYGLTRIRDHFIQFPENITVAKAVGDGIYVCADRTYWLGGRGPGEFNLKELHPFGAVPGTAVTIELDSRVAWFSPKGYMVGDDGGQLKLVTDPNIAVPVYSSGAMLYREERGIRQLVTILRGGTEPSEFEATDYVNAATVQAAE